MALQLSLTDDYNNSYGACYARVRAVEIHRDGSGAISCEFWKDQTTSGLGGANPFRLAVYSAPTGTFTPTAIAAANGNPMAVAYNYLQNQSTTILQGATSV